MALITGPNRPFFKGRLESNTKVTSCGPWLPLTLTYDRLCGAFIGLRYIDVCQRTIRKMKKIQPKRSPRTDLAIR
jgi:hypothetical protein